MIKENKIITELIKNKSLVKNFILSNQGEFPFDLELRSPIDICLSKPNVEMAKLDDLVMQLLEQPRSMRNYIIMMKALPNLLELETLENFSLFFKDANFQESLERVNFAHQFGSIKFMYTKNENHLITWQSEKNFNDKEESIVEFAHKKN